VTDGEAPIRCPVGGKISYATETDAQRALHRVRKARRGRGTRERGFYFHESCRSWHLTGMKQEKRARS
jgi:hypothetical protein